MSKIDRVIEQVKHISFWDINTNTYCVDSTPTIQLIDQLRPYVELTEEFMNQMQYATYPNHPDYPEELTIRDHVFLNKYKKLIQQIKEQ